MTEEIAAALVLHQLLNYGLPIADVVLYTEQDPNKLTAWTFKGLCKFLSE